MEGKPHAPQVAREEWPCPHRCSPGATQSSYGASSLPHCFYATTISLRSPPTGKELDHGHLPHAPVTRPTWSLKRINLPRSTTLDGFPRRLLRRESKTPEDEGSRRHVDAG